MYLHAVPPAPINLSSMNQSSLENITFVWDPVTRNCSDVYYNVSIKNCGSCPSNINATNNIIACMDLVPGQRCNISVQTVQPCGFSEITTLEGIHVAIL